MTPPRSTPPGIHLPTHAAARQGARRLRHGHRALLTAGCGVSRVSFVAGLDMPDAGAVVRSVAVARGDLVAPVPARVGGHGPLERLPGRRRVANDDLSTCEAGLEPAAG